MRRQQRPIERILEQLMKYLERRLPLDYSSSFSTIDQYHPPQECRLHGKWR